MKRTHLSFLLVMSVIVMCSTAGHAYAQRVGKWEKLGERVVDLDMDREVIKCADKGSFKAIKFHVEKAPVNFSKVYVKYATGATDNLNFNETVRQGQDSGELDLRGNKRIIKEIIVYYQAEKKNNKGKGRGNKNATVQVWGKH